MAYSYPLEPMALAFVAFLVYLVLCRRLFRTSSLPLPPGPRRIPVLGNALDMPTGFEWEVFHRWGKEYNSDIIHLNAVGTSIVVLNSVKAAKDLMDKRSSIYSSRPKLTVINKLMGCSWLLPFMPYGTAWKERRRLFQRHFHPSNELIHKPFELQQSRRLLVQLLENPEQYMEHVRHAVGASLLTMAYGIKASPYNDPAVMLADSLTQHLSESVTPLTMIFDRLPFLLPILSPFLSTPVFSKPRDYWGDLVSRFRDDPISMVKRQLADGSAISSFASDALEDLPVKSIGIEEQVKDIAGVVFIGGSSTMNALLHTFFLALIMFPEEQAKAHAELDRVVGRDRLPDFDDQAQLPYLEALLKEIHRWRPAGPLGIPHFLEEDDEYNGYIIPGQSVIIGNAWAMLNHESDYPNPSTFNPERFLKNGLIDPSVRDPATVSFGFGRRICPGIHIAHSTIWILAASILSIFEISPLVDENGKKVMPSGEFCPSLTLQPLPFVCTIKPRHDKAEALVRAANEIS